MLFSFLKKCAFYLKKKITYVKEQNLDEFGRFKEQFLAVYKAWCNGGYVSKTLEEAILTLMVSFLPKNVHFIKKKNNAILCLFLKNVSPSKRVLCFILNNLHFPMLEGIVFYALYKSRVLIIPCKADDLFIYRATKWN